jgi:hypothetical protein
MPWIRHQLEVFLGKPPCSSIDPDEVRVVSLLSCDLPSARAILPGVDPSS